MLQIHRKDLLSPRAWCVILRQMGIITKRLLNPHFLKLCRLYRTVRLHLPPKFKPFLLIISYWSKMSQLERDYWCRRGTHLLFRRHSNPSYLPQYKWLSVRWWHSGLGELMTGSGTCTFFDHLATGNVWGWIHAPYLHHIMSALHLTPPIPIGCTPMTTDCEDPQLLRLPFSIYPDFSAKFQRQQTSFQKVKTRLRTQGL